MVFQDRPLLDTRPDFENLDHGQQDDFKLTFVAPGAATPWKPTSITRRRLKLPFLLGTKAEWRLLRDFLATAGGSRGGFWLPIWLTDYFSYENNQGGTAIKMDEINLRQYFVANQQFAFLALINRLTIEAYEIASISTPDAETEQLNLTAPIAGEFIPRPGEMACCGLMYCRLADDSIKYRFVTDGVVRVSLEFEELPQEYVTPVAGNMPVYLYEFTRGEFTWRMTNWPEPLILEDECWSPDNIKHGSLRSGIDFLPESLELTVATDSPDHPLRFYLSRAAMQVTELQIWETDADTLTFDRDEPLYKGRIGPVRFDANGVIQVETSSLLRLAETQLPRMQMQRTCNHRLFDVNCGLSAIAYQIDGTVSALTDAYIEATAFATEATAQGDAQWFALGKVTVGTETRMVVGQVTSKLYLDEPFEMAVVSDAVSAWPGCNKRVSHCDGRYGNIVNAAMFYLAPNQSPNLEQLLNPQPTGGKK